MNTTDSIFPHSPEQFRDMVQNAVRHYWSVRLGQAKRQRRFWVAYREKVFGLSGQP